MRRLVSIAIVIVGFGAVGIGLSSLAQRERYLVASETQLLSLEGDDAFRASTDSSWDRVLTWSSNATIGARSDRATARFWKGEYAQLEIPRDPTGAITEGDPQILLVEANAMFRRVPTPLDQRSASQLDAVLDVYADVLKKSPGDPTAAYNYEYVARLRDRAVAQKSRARKEGDTDSANPPQTLHGEQGAPPPKPDLDILRTLVPKSGDERRQTEEAGKGERRPRKG